MALGLAVAIGSVALGAMLGLYHRSGPLLGGVRTFALVSAVAVVLAQLLPDALTDLGLWALLITAGAAVLPSVLGRVIGGDDGHGHGHGGGHGAHHPSGHQIGLDVGYAGLLVHQVGDGASIASFTSEIHAGHNHYDVVVAIASHTIPVTALVVLAYANNRGTRSGIYRAAGLAIATCVGVFTIQFLPTAVLEAAHPYISAVVGGLLLHVVAHDWSPGETRDRRGAVELVALALGLLVLLPGAGHHHHEGVSVAERAGHAFVDLTLETAPTLLFGLMIGAALQLLGSRIPMRWLTRGSDLRQAIRGAVVGAPLPICACGVLPVAQSLRMRGGSAALVVAFLLATPELGVETFALTVRFLGWEMAFVRLLAAVAVAIVAALVVAKVVGKRSADKTLPRPSTAPVAAAAHGPWYRRVLHQLDELLEHVGPWTLVGLVAAAYVEATLQTDSLVGLTTFGLDVLLVSLVAVPSYVCAASATPLAAVLLAKGMSPGAVLAGLLLGPATNLATVGFLRSHFGTRATAIGISSLVITIWAIAMALNGWSWAVVPTLEPAHSHEGGVIALAATAVLVALSLRGIWREGLSSWLSALREGLGDPDERHGHGHG
jgi:uncharacterized membrane protein YraQ (UPF0718 family)